MGMGIAFASGFLKGLNDVAREKNEKLLKEQEAEAERKKLLGGWVVELAKTEGFDTSSEGFKNLATEAGLSDLVGVANKMSDVGSTFGYNKLQFNKPIKKWDEDIRPNNPLLAGGTWLRTFDNFSANSTERQRMIVHFKENPNDLDKFLGDVYKYGDYYIDGQRLQKKNPTTGALSNEFIHPEDTYKSLFAFVDELKATVKGPASTTKTADEVTANTHAKIIQDEVTSGLISQPENAFVFTFRTESGERKEDAVEFADQNQIDAMGRIAANLGYGSGREGVQKFITNFSDVGRATNVEDAYTTLLSAVEMEQKGYGDLARTMGGNAAMNQEFSQYLKDEFGGDLRAAVQAYAPLMKIKEDNVPVTGFNKRRVKLKPSDDYFKANGLNREQVIEQYTASQTALKQLEKLDGLLAQDNTPTGLKAAMQSVGFGVFGEGGQLAQFFGSFETEEGTDANTLSQVALNAGFLSKEAAQNLSVIDSLKLSLAAQMARAVDPSGRLSNQDFEIQLRRLGQTGLFTSKPQARAGLGQVINDFKDNTRRLEVLHEVATVPAGEFTKREIRMLKADAVIRRIERANYQPAVAPKADGAAPAVGEPQTGLVLDPSGYYTDGQGNFFKDEQGTNPASMEAVLEAIGIGTDN